MSTAPVTACRAGAGRAWVSCAVERLEREAARSADTHLIELEFPAFPGIHFYFKDEAAHPSGSLKHRLARSLFLYALCNGRLRPGQPVVDASSGSTAISEAWFARLLGTPFIAVLPRDTAPGKLREIRALGGECDLVDACGSERERARGHVRDGACFLDQFGLAERATDWRGNNNIAESIIGQMAREPYREPAWIVCGAGTGGTSATIGRYLRYRRLDTRLGIAEPSGGAYARGWATGDRGARAQRRTLIEGIGRPCVEPGFLFEVADTVIEVEDAASCAASLFLEEILGTRYGGSSGTNLVACLELAAAMRGRGERGSIVTLLCDRGERYLETIYDPDWRNARGLDVSAWLETLRSGLLGRAANPAPAQRTRTNERGHARKPGKGTRTPNVKGTRTPNVVRTPRNEDRNVGGWPANEEMQRRGRESLGTRTRGLPTSAGEAREDTQRPLGGHERGHAT